MKLICTACLLLFCSQCFAEGTSPVPDKLFGVTLGGKYNIGHSKLVGVGDLPIKKFTGMQRYFGQGVHYYFEPRETYKEFNYVERPKKQDDEYCESSFRLYLLPIIPPTITTIEQLEKATLKWEVLLIEWAGEATKDDEKAKDNAYYWAIDTCKTFETDISVKPEIYNDFGTKWYICTFSAGDREFIVDSLAHKSVRLTYKTAVSDKKDSAVENTIRKLRVKEIKPY